MTREISPEWLKMRSDIYIRDNGICWICNKFVELPNYDLGHLVDVCMGGFDRYDNLVVMHTHCNLTKPKHQTLEDAMRWKMSLNIPKYQNISQLSIINSRSKKKQTERTDSPRITSNLTILPIHSETKSLLRSLFSRFKHKSDEITQSPSLNLNIEKLSYKQQMLYKDKCSKIKPATICWIQGHPGGLPMWRLIAPPYGKEDSFVMRSTPPGAKEPTGKTKIANTVQIIGGTLKQSITLDTGISRMIISPDGKNLKVEMTPTSTSNVGKREQTIGWGIGQIPVEEWKAAKSQGISIDQFKSTYHLKSTQDAPS